MIVISRVKQAIDEFIKVLRYGKSDVQTADQVAPFGLDSKPIKDVLAVHSTTSSSNDSLILGYIIKLSNKTDEGETYFYSMDASGNIKANILLKKDGVIEINGNTDNAVRYAALNTAIQTFITNLNLKLTTAFATVPYTWVNEPLNISAAKIDDIKTS